VPIAELALAERQLRDATVAELRRNVDADEVQVRRTVDLRYAGQNYELEVPLPDGDLDDARWRVLLDRFQSEHERQYGFSLPGEAVELINLRMSALRPEGRIELGLETGADHEPEVREVWFDAERPVECPIYRRDGLVPGDELGGPAVIEEPDSTTLVFETDRLVVHASGVLVLTIGGRS